MNPRVCCFGVALALGCDQGDAEPTKSRVQAVMVEPGSSGWQPIGGGFGGHGGYGNGGYGNGGYGSGGYGHGGFGGHWGQGYGGG